MKILLVEDERRMSEALAYILRKQNMQVDVAEDGLMGQELAATGAYDVIVMDRMLPGKEGVAVVKQLRADGVRTPVLFVTARDAVDCRVEGLNAGGDDYLIKPFSTEELIARVKALGRRSEHIHADNRIRIASMTMDPMRLVALCGEREIKFTQKEAQLLEYFMRNPGQVLTKEQIFERVWGFQSESELNNVEIYIYYLRKKLDGVEWGASIQTVRGIGYCLQEDRRVSRA